MMYEVEQYQSEIVLGQGMKAAPLLWDIYLGDVFRRPRRSLKTLTRVKI